MSSKRHAVVMECGGASGPAPQGAGTGPLPGKKRKLKRRERNHERREKRAQALTGAEASSEAPPGQVRQSGAAASPLAAAAAAAAAVTPGLVDGRPLTADPTLSAQDLATIVEQLGFIPTNLVRVVARDPTTQSPTVCQLYPLTRPAKERRRKGGEKDFEPFPTMFWMTCPLLKARVSALEDDGWVAKLEARLAASEPDRRRMADAHAAYGRRRWALLSPADVALVEARGWVGPLRDVGIAGMRNTEKVKCLHTQLAYWLALQQQCEGGVGVGGDVMGGGGGGGASGGAAAETDAAVELPVGAWINELLMADAGAIAAKAKETGNSRISVV